MPRPLAPMLLAGVLVAGLSAPPGAAASGLSAERVAHLNRFVRQDCGSCHGMTLKGGLGRPLTVEALADISAETLSVIILDGIPDSAMPPWRGLLSEAEVGWIANALKEGRIR